MNQKLNVASTALAVYLSMEMMAKKDKAESQSAGAAVAEADPNVAATGETAAATEGTGESAPAEGTNGKTVNGKANTYFFKTPTLKDEAGNEIGKGTKPPDVKVLIPVPTINEVANYLGAADGTKEAKVRDLLMDMVFDTLVAAGRRQINEWLDANPDKNFSVTDMDISKLNLQVVADTPKGQRGAWAPDEADFKEFNELYTEVLVHATGYDPKKTKTHTDHWKTGMSKVKTDKRVIGKLKEFLTVFAANVKEKEQLEEVSQTYEWLMARADKYLKLEEKNFLAAL